LVECVFQEQSKWHMVTERSSPQMVRDQKKFGKHYTRLTKLLLASNSRSSWNKARIATNACVCYWTTWI